MRFRRRFRQPICRRCSSNAACEFMRTALAVRQLIFKGITSLDDLDTAVREDRGIGQHAPQGPLRLQLQRSGGDVILLGRCPEGALRDGKCKNTRVGPREPTREKNHDHNFCVCLARRESAHYGGAVQLHHNEDCPWETVFASLVRAKAANRKPRGDVRGRSRGGNGQAREGSERALLKTSRPDLTTAEATHCSSTSAVSVQLGS